jgi:NDP-sugar pyrophosphorylase family protein
MTILKSAPNDFFDLSSFDHASIFEGLSHIWEVLAHIHSYLQQRSLGKIETEIPAGVVLKNVEQISIGPGTIVEEGSYIRGPCIIGARCTVRQGAYIRGDLVTGDRCVIGHDTEIKNALLLNDVHAAHFAYVGDSILGNQVNLGAGTKCANLKLDQTPIDIVWEGKRFSTQLRKFGAVLGDQTQIGCNVVLNPGTLLGRDVLCYPCLNVGGVIPSHHIIKSNNSILVTAKIGRNRYD